MNLPNIVSFSGGQTSGYMLRMLMDANPATFDKEFRVIFENTGKEHDATLDFVHEVETKWSVPVVWLEYTRVPANTVPVHLVPEGRKRANLLKAQNEGKGAHWFKVVDYSTASRRFEKGPFDELLEWAAALPNVRGRSCSAFLKIRTQQKYLEALGVVERVDCIGIRADEAHRAHEILANSDDKNRKPRFPLIEDGIVNADVVSFWNAHPFRLNIPNFMGNCDLCFLKSRWKRLALAEAEPKAAQWWADWEKRFETKAPGDGATFRKGESYEGLINEATQPRLPGISDEDVACSCAVGGYRSKEEEDDL